MLDYFTIAGLDWSRVRMPKAAPCPHGMMGAPYCVPCLAPILEQAAKEQDDEARQAELAKARREGAAAARQREEDTPSDNPGPPTN